MGLSSTDSPKSRTFVVDYDGTITAAPDQLAVISVALRAQGHKVIVLTGNTSPRDDLLKQLSDYGFEHDGLIQYNDEESDGGVRARYLKRLDCWFGIDNRADRAVIFADVAPHAYIIAKPNKRDKNNAKDGLDKSGVKKDVKKQLKRCLLIGGPHDGRIVEHRGLSNILDINGELYRLQDDGSATYEPDDH